MISAEALALIPDEELQEDLDASYADALLCKKAIRHRSFSEKFPESYVVNRLITNLEIINIIQTEQKRREIENGQTKISNTQH